MNYEEIKKIIDDMTDSKLDELKIEFPDGTKIKMKKKSEPVMPVQTPEVVKYVATQEQAATPQKTEKQEEPEYKVEIGFCDMDGR